MTDIIFVGGIGGKEKWLNDGKSFSRNYRQGDRVYSANGIATVLTANPVGSTGGYTSLYLVDERMSDNLTNIKRNKGEYSREIKPFTYASLFSGIGGFESALNRLGGRCVFASEIDKFARQAYAVLYGFEPAGDITKIDVTEIPDHDVLTAGFPCPSFSVAGKGNGMEYECQDCGNEHLITYEEYKKVPKCPRCNGFTEPKDPRGVLFFEIARIAEAKYPKILLLENVKGLVNHAKGRTLSVMIQTLCDIGYTIDFNVLNSKYFGVPQNRERIFIIGVRDDLITPEPWEIEGTNVLARGKRRIAELDGIKTFNFDWPPQEEVTVMLRDILETDVNEKYYLSEDKTSRLIEALGKNGEPNVAGDVKMVGRVDISGHDYNRRVYSIDGISKTLPTCSGGNLEPKIAEPQEIASGKDISYCIDANYSKGISPGSVNKGRRTNVLEVRPVTSPDYDHKTQNGRRIKGTDEPIVYGECPACEAPLDFNEYKSVECYCGKITHFEEVRAVTSPDYDHKTQNGRRIKDTDEPMFTLTAQDRHGVAIGQPPKYRIRKLTPKECWRLQNFTDEQHDAVAAAGISDSQRYKMAGNAVTVSVIESIGERMLPLLSAKEAATCSKN